MLHLMAFVSMVFLCVCVDKLYCGMAMAMAMAMPVPSTLHEDGIDTYHFVIH